MSFKKVAIGDAGRIAEELNESTVILCILESKHINGAS
jgi:hypothetical protein